MTDPEILAMAKDAVAKRLYCQHREDIGFAEKWEQLADIIKEDWIREANDYLSIRLNEKGEPDPEGNIRVGVYLEKSSFAPFAGIPHDFRKVVQRDRH